MDCHRESLVAALFWHLGSSDSMNHLKFAPFNLIFGTLYSVILLVFFRITRSTNLLLIGDSLDRHIVTSWCRQHGVTKDALLWGHKDIMYGRKAKQPTVFCNSSNGDSIASLHVFGSSNGPYLWIQEDKASSTTPRIKLALQSYEEQIGKVDTVIFNAVHWDLRPQTVEDEFRNTTININVEPFLRSLETMKNDTNDRLDELIKLVGVNVVVGLRNSPYALCYNESSAGKLLREYNNMVRSVAKSRNLTFYDYDNDLWSSVGYNYSMRPHVFEDLSHPKPYYSRSAGEKLLRRKYSQMVEYTAPAKNRCSFGSVPLPYEGIHYLIHNCTNITVSLLLPNEFKSDDIGKGMRYPLNTFNTTAAVDNSSYFMDIKNLYYTENTNGTRYTYTGVTEEFLLSRHLGPADIFMVPIGIIQSIIPNGSIDYLPPPAKHRKHDER